jgi:acyl-CoA synthetase (AMP-forming)/AMP-acid ligase II/pimeloyl-ACP methyl ester carboxylesterase
LHIGTDLFDRAQFTDAYPFAAHWHDLGGLRMHYVDEGGGPPVLMLHGNPTWSFYYRRLVKALRGDFRCIAPDHVGCGLSDKPPDRFYRYSLESRVRDVESLLDHLGIDDDLTLAVHDWGGMIGAAVALRRPERVRRLVILNTAAFLLPAGKSLPIRLRVIRRSRILGPLAVRGFNAFSALAARMATANGLAREVRHGLTAPYDSWANRIATLRFVQDIPLAPGDESYDLCRQVDDDLHKLTNRPTLICWGMKDFVFDPEFLAEWRRRMPDAEVHEYADAGHYILEDVPTDVIARIGQFLRRDATPAAPQAPGPRPHPPGAFLNVAHHLRAAAAANPDQDALVWTARRSADGRAEYASLSFRQLDAETDRVACGLLRAGVRRGTRTILLVRPRREFFVLTFALYKVGAVPVLIDPGMGKSRMVHCLRSVSAEAFIGIPAAHALRAAHRSAFRSVRVAITLGPRYAWGGLRYEDLDDGVDAPFDIAATRPDDPAAIIFTTGSTGPPKAVLFQHRTFDAQVRVLREYFGIEPGEIDLPTFPLFALFDPALGMTAVIPDMDPTRPAHVDPKRIVGAICDRKVTHMFGSPALLDRVSRYTEANDIKLPTLRRVLSAGAPMAPEVLARFAASLNDDARIHTPYGATEALPVASIDHREILGQTRARTEDGGGACVGEPLRHGEVRIIRITDEPIAKWTNDLQLPDGEVGEIVARGPTVTRQYLCDEEANRMHKIREGDGVWHRMGDVGYFDERGRLWFCGRKAHRVITANGTLLTIPCEAIFNRHPRVQRSALVGVGDPPGQRPVICIELNADDTRANLDGLTVELLALARGHQKTSEITTVLYHPAFPVDIRHNAKIFRERLRDWAASRLASQ